MTNDIESLSLTLHGVNGHFIEKPPMVKTSKSATVQKVGKIFKNKKTPTDCSCFGLCFLPRGFQIHS